MTKGFLIVVCITITIVLILFPLIVSYKEQKNKKKLNVWRVFNIIFKSIKLDKSLYTDSKNFGEASIYFAGLIMILDGIAGAVAANNIIKTAVAMSGLTAIITWFIWAILIFVIGVKLFPDKQTKTPLKKF